MDADFSVELGADDDALEFPWLSPDGHCRYYDLKSQPDLLLYISEAQEYEELGRYLATVNSEASEFLTAKCDVWMDEELSPAEDIYEAKVKFGCYVDHLFVKSDNSAEDRRFSFERHEQLAERLVGLLGLVPPISAAAEFVIRRCYYHLDDEPVRPGYYFTFYLFGYGDDAADARRRWGVALDLLQNAVLQVSAEVRRRTL